MAKLFIKMGRSIALLALRRVLLISLTLSSGAFYSRHHIHRNLSSRPVSPVLGHCEHGLIGSNYRESGSACRLYRPEKLKSGGPRPRRPVDEVELWEARRRNGDDS